MQPPATRGRALAWIVLASAIAACASDPANQVVEGQAGAPGVRQVLLCPLNLVVALRPEIQNGSQPVDRELVGYLESVGEEVSRLGLIEGRKLWKQAVAEAKAANALTRAPEIFVASLAQNRAFDAVVMPSLILVQTRMDANTASWDGVSRKMRMGDVPAVGTRREDATTVKAWHSYTPLSGPAWVTSLHVLVFARDGRRVFEGRGGIDFLQEVDLIEVGKGYRYTLGPNGTLFEDRALLAEGVAQAFRPYLVPPGE